MAQMLFVAGCVNPNKLPGIRSLSEREAARLNQQAEEAIKKSPALQELDDFCVKQVPPQLDFNRVSRNLDFGGRMSLTYAYHSKEGFRKVADEYKNYLSPQGWRLTHEEEATWGNSTVAFANDEYALRLYFLGAGSGVNYKLHCEKLKR